MRISTFKGAVTTESKEAFLQAKAIRQNERWPGKLGQGVKWISCLTAAMMPRVQEAR